MTAAILIPSYTAGTWDIDPVHSDVSFTVRHMMVSKVRGRLGAFSGEIVTAPQFTDSAVTATVDATSVDTGNAQRDGHIRTADFDTIGVDDLRTIVEPYTPEHVADICGIDAGALRRAARIFGESKAVLSTVLQGFYQSHQATAASVAVHNLHLLRGMIGRPGAGILQMNGQPTAQNNRECGADGDLPGFRNWDNPRHVEELARAWNVDVVPPARTMNPAPATSPFTATSTSGAAKSIPMFTRPVRRVGTRPADGSRSALADSQAARW